MAFVRTQSQGGIEMRIPAAYYRTRGAFMGLTGLALGSACCCLPLGLLLDGEPIGGDGGEFILIMLLFGTVLSVVVPAIGGAIALNASSLAARSWVRIADGQLTTHVGPMLELATVARFELGPRAGEGALVIRGWPRWLAIDTSGRTHVLSEGVHPMLDGRRAAKALAALSADLGKPFENRGRLAGLGLSAPICYLPIGGFFLPASLASVVFGRDAKVRFAAKQSLLHFALTIGVAVVLGGLCVAALALSAFADMTPAIVVLPGGLLFFSVFVLNVVLRLYAMYRSHRDPLWVMPWLARITRPWAQRVVKPDPISF